MFQKDDLDADFRGRVERGGSSLRLHLQGGRPRMHAPGAGLRKPSQRAIRRPHNIGLGVRPMSVRRGGAHYNHDYICRYLQPRRFRRWPGELAAHVRDTYVPGCRCSGLCAALMGDRAQPCRKNRIFRGLLVNTDPTMQVNVGAISQEGRDWVWGMQRG